MKTAAQHLLQQVQRPSVFTLGDSKNDCEDSARNFHQTPSIGNAIVYEEGVLFSSLRSNDPNHLLQLLQQFNGQISTKNGGLMNEYLSFNEIADDLGVPVRTVYFLNQQGKAPKAIKIGRTFRVSRMDYESWKRENTN